MSNLYDHKIIPLLLGDMSQMVLFDLHFLFFPLLFLLFDGFELFLIICKPSVSYESQDYKDEEENQGEPSFGDGDDAFRLYNKASVQPNVGEE